MHHLSRSIGGLLLAVAQVLLSAPMAGCVSRSDPNGAEKALIRTYSKSRQALTELEILSRKPEFQSCVESLSDPKCTPSERLGITLALKPVGRKAFLLPGPGSGFRVAVRFGNMSPIAPTWIEGFAFLPGESARKATPINSFRGVASRAADTYVRKIEGSWYLYYERFD
jgi:hypothetical protein